MREKKYYASVSSYLEVITQSHNSYNRLVGIGHLSTFTQKWFFFSGKNLKLDFIFCDQSTLYYILTQHRHMNFIFLKRKSIKVNDAKNTIVDLAGLIGKS